MHNGINIVANLMKNCCFAYVSFYQFKVPVTSESSYIPFLLSGRIEIIKIVNAADLNISNIKQCPDKVASDKAGSSCYK